VTFAGPFPGHAPRPRPQLHLRWHPRPWLVGLVLGVIVVLILLATVGTDLLVNLLFYREVHFSRVFTTVLVTRLILFVLGAVVGGAVLSTNLALGHVLRPAYLPVSPEQQALDTYRTVITPARRWIAAALGAVGALAFGLYAQGRWTVVQLWLHGQSFHQRDPLFHRDLSYFAFQRPFEVAVVHVAMVMVFLGFLIAAASHYFWGGLRVQTRGEKLSGAARSHLSILVGLFLLLKAMNYWLDRFGLTLSSGASGTTGADYTDVHATLQAKTILVFIAAICAVLCFANAVRRGWLLAAAGLGAMVLAAFVVGFLVPVLVQQFHVKPNQITLEAPYVQRSIAATRQAYQIEPSTAAGGTVDTTTYSAPAAPPASTVTTTNANIANSRLLDPNQLQPTFEQLQQIRSYYSFPQALDIDRYTIDGKEQSYVLATRDVNLNGLAANQHNWVNDHLVYTHGQGIVAAETSQVDANGRPVFSVGGLPESGANGGPSPITVDQSRIYFGELSPTYSIVDTKQPEQDGTGAANYHYDGTGGVSVGSKLGTRLALALHFRDYNLLFSSSLTKSSRILYYRDPRQRIAKVAPWLTLDGDPYPAVVDGRVTWIVDGYTTSDNIPYSQRVSLGGTTTTSQSTASNVSSQSGTSINYIRNSVKATVDAYTGKVTLYAFENGVPDPVLRTWESVFPGTVQPESAISPELRAHLRYPEDLFTVQRDLLAKYHVSDAKTFIQSSDFWQVATDPVNTGENQAPYYEELQMPGQSGPEFQLATSLTYNLRPNLAAFVAVSSDPSDYGEMRVLQLPDDTVLQGPANVFSSIKADPSFAQQFTLLNQNGSTFIPGNLLTLPVGGGLLFVQPYYIRAAGGAGASADSFPLLHFVVVDYGDKVGYAPTLAGALAAALSGGGSSTATTTPTSPTSPTTAPSTSSSVSPGADTVAALRQDVTEDFAAAKTALTAGDLGAYQTAVAQAQSDYAKLLAAQGAAPSTPASPTVSPSPAPS
jgi:uncharacterized membrane protein (UPF0182 family)